MTGAREANSRKIRAALISAGADLLGQYPIDAITINQIVETAGVAKGSFYNHFADKESLAATVSTAIREEVEQKIRDSNRNVTDPAYRMARGICLHLRLAVIQPKRAAIMLRIAELATSGDYALNRHIQGDIEDGIATGRYHRGCEDAGIIVVMGTTMALMLRIIEQGLDVEQTIELTAKTLSLVLGGFGLQAEEALRIVTDSARDIIDGSDIDSSNGGTS